MRQTLLRLFEKHGLDALSAPFIRDLLKIDVPDCHAIEIDLSDNKIIFTFTCVDNKHEYVVDIYEMDV